MSSLRELDLVSLRQPLPSAHFEPGDVGTVVFVYPNHEAYEVEIMEIDGETVAVETL